MTGADQESIIRRWLDLVSLLAPDERIRKAMFVVALTFAELAGRAPLWKQLLKETNMGESQFLNGFRAEGKVENARAYLIRVL